MAAPMSSGGDLRGVGDASRIARDLAHVDKRVAVLETRAEVAEGRLKELHTGQESLRAESRKTGERIGASLDAIAGSLHAHVEEEAVDRVKLLRAVIATLVSAILGLIAWGGPLLWQHLIVASTP